MPGSMDGFGEGFCRDCLAVLTGNANRCRHCGSPRLARHAELNDLHIGHVDCDAFFAAVEKRDNPDLRDKPVIIGGGSRGVVSTACYIARIHGVHSAMPMFKALKACPEAVVIKPDMEKYVRVGMQVRAMMQALTPAVEPVSIDEAFLDLSGTIRLHGASPALVLARFARTVESEIGISVSIGLSYCKFLAKIASDLRKPRGFAVIGRKEALSFLADKPVSLIWGVGRVFEQKLRSDGIHTIGQLQHREREDLLRAYGSMGDRLYHLARGIDARAVRSDRSAKSISSETTFLRDLSLLEELVPTLRTLSERVSLRLKRKQLAGRTIVLKLKDEKFRIRTRSHQLADATRLADRIFSVGLSLLRPAVDGTRYRLLGIGVSDLGSDRHADPQDLVDPGAGKRVAAELAVDALRARFGGRVIETGYTFRLRDGDREKPAPSEE